MSFTMFPKNAAQCCSPLDAVLVSHHLEVGLLDGLLVHGGGHVVLKREHISIKYTNYLFYLQCRRKRSIHNLRLFCTLHLRKCTNSRL